MSPADSGVHAVHVCFRYGHAAARRTANDRDRFQQPRLFPDRTTKANEPPKSNGGQ